MEESLAFLLLGFSFLWIYSIYALRTSKSKSHKLPPGPFPFPIFGSLFKLGNKPHKSLTELSKTYGPIMTLKLGYLTTVVVSSAAMAKEILNTHDRTFADRTIPDAARALDHHKTAISWLPASSHEWRFLRKVCVTQIFNSKSLDANQNLRQKKVQELIDYIGECSKISQAINIGRVAFTTTLNLISNTLFSIDLAHFSSESSKEFKDIVGEILEETGKPNIVDFFPVLRKIDPQGTRHRMETCFTKLFKLFDGLIEERLQSRTTRTVNHDLLDSLLDHSEQNSLDFNHTHIKNLLSVLFAAGTDTSASTLEWAMAELLRNPSVMAKARIELKEIVGKQKSIEESDIPKLPYLKAIVKETLRLHPPAPLLVPHKAITNVEVCNFIVPKDAQVIVNAWAIGRDSSIWEDPYSFKPERFLGLDIDFKGQNFELIPFGAGRRMCPGLPLASRMVHLVLASLLHSFDWVLEDGMAPHDIDMQEKFGLTLQKYEPILALPVQD